MAREPLSLVVTTLDNAATLARCLDSAAFADDILVLDSGSTDATRAIAEAHGARIERHAFDDYAAQKQRAIALARHDWILLLDADEALTPAAAAIIQRELRAPRAAGYRLPRREQMFWTFQHRRSRINTHLRLFDRRHGGMNAVPVHAAPEVRGRVRTLRAAVFLHFGEPDIATKVRKLNDYSSGLVAHKRARGTRFVRTRMLLYPPLFFLRQYLFKRYFLNGWAGYISAASGAWYVFLKYAKLYEARRDQGGAGDDSGGRAS